MGAVGVEAMRDRYRRGILALLALGVLLGSSGCLDVRDYRGTWAGPVLADPMVRQGFTESAEVQALVLDNVDLKGVTATLTTNDGRFKDTPLTRVTKFQSDTLASLTFDGKPVRTFLHFAPLSGEPAGCPAMIMISLFPDERVELRVVRGNELFGVFRLSRK